MQTIIESFFDNLQNNSDAKPDKSIIEAVHETINQLDCGKLRVAEPTESGWQINTWVKQAILLYFKFTPSERTEAGYTQFFDKVPVKYQSYTQQDFERDQTRVVPDAIVRKGAYIGKNTVLMPSFVNIGAYVDDNSMIDTWATVGAAAQIGKNVHISGGAGIGGVLEPLQANPVIIEDNCFIGARSEVAEGVIVERGSVLAMGVYIGQSTRIFNRETGETYYGRVPAGSVVVPGSLPSSKGECHLYSAIIVKQVEAQTLSKTALNEILRSAGVSA